MPQPETDADAIGLAVQELVSGTGIPTRGIGLWMTVTEMRKPGPEAVDPIGLRSPHHVRRRQT